jgi:hypothetical protein
MITPRPRHLLPLLLVACPRADDAASEATAATQTTTTTTTTTAPSTGSLTETTGAPAAEWVAALKLGVEHGALLSVWGPNPSEVYAVGGQLGPDLSRGILFVHDGLTWSESPLPEGTPALNWVTGVGGELWVVGHRGAALRREDGLWVSHETGVEVMLWGIWGAAPGDVWAVGGDGAAEDPTLLHWDGAAWSFVQLPPYQATSRGLFKVWGSAADDVHIVADGGLTLRWDGAQWQEQPSGSTIDLISLWGRSSAEIIAVGGRANAHIARWDGASWTGETFLNPGLNGVWVDGSGHATLVGAQGTILALAPGASAPEPEQSGTFLLLHAVHGFDGGPRFAVGGSLNQAPPYVGILLEHRP